MFNLGFLWLALSIGYRNHRHLDESKNQRLQQTGAFGAGGLRLRPVLLRPHPRDEHHSGGRSYSLWCGFGIVGVTICSMILYKQKPDLAAIIAMALIISGGVIMNVFSTM